ncbi:MAG: methyltransferase domain-containing protein [Candidatus Promineifilaceae bacterium]|nr:methyltransferase domain-containing protein [Candidatus Promineifilaceae bacterium]
MTEYDSPPVCDYEGSDYRTRFWEGTGRGYEDQVERIALRRLMPPRGQTLLDVGAGFGRLAEEYRGYERVVLFDYSRSLLREAQARLQHDPRFIFVAGNWYEMPFVEGLFETMVQVRTLHHAADVPALFAELGRVAAPGGSCILEFANKQNLKAMLRHAAGRQSWSPYSEEPIEFVELNFDFHPRWIQARLDEAGFSPDRILTVSHFRLAPLKRLVPTPLLVAVDSVAQYTGNWWQFTPSVFVSSRHPAVGAVAAPDTFFACPNCRGTLAETETGNLRCEECGREWGVESGLYDFKEPL